MSIPVGIIQHVRPARPLYGPPTDPAEQDFAAGVMDVPWEWGGCVVFGVVAVVVGARMVRHARYDQDWRDVLGGALLIAGVVLGLTAPAGGLVLRAAWGHFPTVDKLGSMHFLGQHACLAAFDTGTVATRLIGVSLGHLCIGELLVSAGGSHFPGFAAMNIQALFNLWLAGWTASRLFREVGATRWAAIIAALPLALSLHQLRDVNWYTIEKSGVGWLFLYAWMLVRANERGLGWIGVAAAAYLWAFFYNSYWGVLGAVGAGLALPFLHRTGRLAVALSAVAALPLVIRQLPALANPTLPGATAFAERAALDVLTLTEWNRLELYAALDIPSIVLAAAAIPLVSRKLLAAAAIPVILALGPATPVWTAFTMLPGMWRFSKPETFFHLDVLVIGTLASLVLSRRTPRQQVGIAVLMLISWLVLVRTHPVYPGFSRFE